MHRESDLHQNICDYIRLQHRGVIFHTDFAAGTKLTMGQAVRNKRLQSSRAWPDLFIPEPHDNYCGFFLELKKEGTHIYLKDGVTLIANEHVREQADVLRELSKRGYYAKFAIGFEEAKQHIDWYLSRSPFRPRG